MQGKLQGKFPFAISHHDAAYRPQRERRAVLLIMALPCLAQLNGLNRAPRPKQVLS
jgi:hypothetical protein